MLHKFNTVFLTDIGAVSIRYLTCIIFISRLQELFRLLFLCFLRGKNRFEYFPVDMCFKFNQRIVEFCKFFKQKMLVKHA